jgi:hypothetical protein
MSTSTVQFSIAGVRYSTRHRDTGGSAVQRAGRRRSGPSSSRVTAMMRTSACSIRLAHPSASGPGPEPDKGRLVDQLVGHCQACDITSGSARSLKLSAKRARSSALTGKSATAASWASLRGTYSLRDLPNLRARASRTVTDIIGHIAYQHVCHHNLQPISE